MDKRPSPPLASTEFGDDSVWSLDPHCTVREQVGKYLVYNSRTDEMYLIGPAGKYICDLCDGISTLAEIERALCPVPSESSRERGNAIRRFVRAMSERGILEHLASEHLG